MPTAILMIYTSDGFVAAPMEKATTMGIRCATDAEDIQTKRWRSHYSLIYGVSGAASVLDKDGGTDILKQAYQPVLEHQAAQEFPTLDELC